MTAYATELKHRLLGVDATLLAQCGAVDPQVAAEMAAGVRKALGADWGIATTGVAGPDPQDGQPVGTVFVAVDGPFGPGPGSAGGGKSGSAEVERSAGGNSYGECTERTRTPSEGACERTDWE
ncbi:hypothetical protein GCM10020295_21600 [Streptomyces cinereospinus]